MLKTTDPALAGAAAVQAKDIVDLTGARPAGEHDEAKVDAAAAPWADGSHTLPSPAHAWWSVAVLTLLYALSMMDRQVIALLVNDIRRDLGVSDFAVGLLNGLAFASFYVSFGLVFGWASDRTSRRGLIFGGLTIWSLATAACGLARTMPQILFARFGVGAGEAALNPSAYSLIADSFPRERLSTATSVFGAGSHLGGAISLLLGAFIIGLIPASGIVLPLVGPVEPWRAVFILLGLPGVAIGLLVWTIADPGRRTEPGQKKMTLRDTLSVMRSNRRFYLAHNFGFALMVSASYGFAAWAPTHLIRNLDVPVGWIGVIMASLVLCVGMPGTVLGGYMVDRLFARGVKDAHLRVFLFLAWFQLAGLVGVALSSNLTMFIVSAALFIGTSSYPGVAAAALQIVSPSSCRGQVSAVFMAIFGLVGAGIGPMLVGGLTTHLFADDKAVGWAIAGGGMIMLPLASLCLYLALRPMREALAAKEAQAA